MALDYGETDEQNTFIIIKIKQNSILFCDMNIYLPKQWAK